MVLEDQYDAYQVFEELRNRGIKTLIYAGYVTNMCVLVRPIGMIQAKGQNFNVILVRDATIAVETPESLYGEWAHKMAVRFVELNFGYTTTVEDFRIAVIKAQLPYATFLPIVFNPG
jgi:nicotinamidase-related amidase